jgi:hypothetical protein
VQFPSSLVNLLGVVIALVGVYVAFALLASWTNERIASWLQLRGKNLLAGIERMVGTDAAAGILASPFIHASSGTQSARGANVTRAFLPRAAGNSAAFATAAPPLRPPSYVSAAQFASALVEWLQSQRQSSLTLLEQKLQDLLDPKHAPPLPDDVASDLATIVRTHPSGEDLASALAAYDPGDALEHEPALQSELDAARALAAGTADAFTAELDEKVSAASRSLRNLLNTIPDDRLRRQLLTIFRSAEGDLARFDTGVRTWFDDQMDRVSGWYQRANQWKLIIVACLIAVAFNVDSIAIYERLAANPALAAAGAQAAESLQTGERPASIVTACPANAASAKAPCKDCPGGFIANASGGCILDTSYLVQLPLGWDWTVLRGHVREGWSGAWWFGFKLLGLGVSALAISLGAPFWFNVLGIVTSVRSAGPKPQRDDGAPVKAAS